MGWRGRKDRRQPEGLAHKCCSKPDGTGEPQCTSLTVSRGSLRPNINIIGVMKFSLSYLLIQSTHALLLTNYRPMHISMLAAHFHNTFLVHNVMLVCCTGNFSINTIENELVSIHNFRSNFPSIYNLLLFINWEPFTLLLN